MARSQIQLYIAAFILNFLEGSIITLGAGISLRTTGLNPLFLVSVLIVADILSDMFYYSIGRFGGDFLRIKIFKLFRIKDQQIIILRKYYEKHGIATLFIAKMSDVLAMPAILLAGFVTMKFHLFMALSVASAIIKGILLFSAGYLIARGDHTLPDQQLFYAVTGSSTLLLSVLIFRYNYRKIKKG